MKLTVTSAEGASLLGWPVGHFAERARALGVNPVMRVRIGRSTVTLWSVRALRDAIAQRHAGHGTGRGAEITGMEQSRSGLLSGSEAGMSASWTADLPVTAVDNVAGTFTASTADPLVIVMAVATRAKALEVTVTMDDGIAVPVLVGDVLRFASRVAT